MKIYQFLKKILNYLLIIDFSILKKNNILIFSALSFYELNKIVNYKYQLMDIPSKKINVFILIQMILKFKFKKIDYLYFYTMKINPKIFISTYDNDINVYNLKNRFPKIKFILIQNGKRGGIHDIFNNEFKKLPKKKYFIDHFFVFGPAVEKKYKKFISGKFYNIGSIRNNLTKIKNEKKDNKKLVLISQFRPKFKLYLKYQNMIIDHHTYCKNSEILFKLLEKFCFENKLKLLILPSLDKNNNDFPKEREFFQNLSKYKNYKLLEKNSNLDSYKIINQYDIFFGVDSTLIYEALSRNKRIGSFSRIKNIDLYSFTWPLKHSSKGYFFSNNLNINEVERIYRNISKVNEKNWSKKIEFYKKNLMCFNYNNTKIKNLIRKEVNESN